MIRRAMSWVHCAPDVRELPLNVISILGKYIAPSTTSAAPFCTETVPLNVGRATNARPAVGPVVGAVSLKTTPFPTVKFGVELRIIVTPEVPVKAALFLNSNVPSIK
jgi:hypothetical protein